MSSLHRIKRVLSPTSRNLAHCNADERAEMPAITLKTTPLPIANTATNTAANTTPQTRSSSKGQPTQTTCTAGRDIRCLNKDGLQHHDSSSVPRFPFIKREDGRRAGAKVVLLLLTLHPAKILWNFTALHDPIPRQYSPRALLPTDESHVQWLVSPGHHIASSYRTDGIAGPCNYSSRVLCSARTTDIVRSGASHRSCPHHVG